MIYMCIYIHIHNVHYAISIHIIYTIYIYILYKYTTHKFTRNAIVRLPHPRSGDSQGQETFLALSTDKQTHN